MTEDAYDLMSAADFIELAKRFACACAPLPDAREPAQRPENDK